MGEGQFCICNIRIVKAIRFTLEFQLIFLFKVAIPIWGFVRNRGIGVFNWEEKQEICLDRFGGNSGTSEYT